MIAHNTAGGDYTIAAMGGYIEPGRRVIESAPDKNPDVYVPYPPPRHAAPEVDRVIDVWPAVVLVAWQAVNQMLPRSTQNDLAEPKRIWFKEEIAQLTCFDDLHNVPPTVARFVVFTDEDDDKSEFGPR